MKCGDVVFLDGLVKVEVVRVLPDHAVVMVLEDHSKLRRGEELLTRKENLQKVKAQ